MIIGLGYQAQVGKDTVGRILVEEHGFARLAFADALKDLALHLDPIISNTIRLSRAVEVYGWEHAKGAFPEVREFLQRLGEGCRKKLADGIWMNRVLDEIYGNPNRDYVVTDVRYRNEARGLVKTANDLKMPVAIVHVRRPGFDGANNHSSETELAGYGFDHVLHNNGTVDDLGHAVSVLVERVAGDALVPEPSQ